MKNLGITNYASLVSMKLNNEMEIHINPVEETKNVHYVLPLYHSNYKRPLSLQLIYNHQNMSIDLGLGKGIRSNYHMSLDYNDYEAYLTLSDGSTLIYPFYKSANSGKTKLYKNEENKTTISVYEGTLATQFFLYLKNNTVIEFTVAGNKLMQKSIKYKNGEEYYFEYDSSGRMIVVKNNADKVEKLTFDYDSNDYVLIQAWKTNKNNQLSEVKAIKLYKHTAANYLDFLWNVYVYDNSNSTVLLKDYYFVYSIPGGSLNTQITENTSKCTCTYKVSINGLPESMKDQLGRETTFTSINQYCSKITDYRNRESELLVDGKGRLICLKDNFKNSVISTMFDENNKLISSSKIIHYNPALNGKLKLMNSHVPNDLMTITATTTPDFLSNYYYTNKCYNASTISTIGAKYVQIYNIEGNKFDVYSLGVWSKVNSFESINGYATINIFFTNSLGDYKNGLQFSKEIKITLKDIIEQEYEFYMTSAYAKQAYKYIVVELCYYNSAMSMDIIFDLYKRGLTKLHEYDGKGNQITMLDGRSISELVFNGDNSVASTKYLNYEYDEKGNVIKTKDVFGKEEAMTYDDSNNLLTQSITNDDIELFNKYEYLDEETISLSEDTNDIELEAEYSNDYLKNKVKQLYDSTNMLFENYEYNENNKEQVVSKTYKDNDVTQLSKINYSYNSGGKISTLSNNETNAKITFTYDAYGQHYGYKINNNMFLYNTYSLINGVPEIIYSSGIGMKDAYYYEYDSYDRLIKVTYCLDSSTLFEYTYDDKDNITSVKDCVANITYVFEYDEENNLISYSYDDLVINNVLDDSNSLCAKQTKIDNIKLVTSSYAIFKSLNNDFDTYKQSIRNDSNIMLCMCDEFAISYNESETSEVLTKYEQKVKLMNTKTACVINSTSSENDVYCDKDGFLTLYNLYGTNPITFNCEGKVNTNNSVAFSFKPTSSGTLLILSDGTSTSLKVGLDSSNKLIIIDNNTIIFTSTNSYQLNVWHFMCVTFDLATNTLSIKIDDDEFSTTFTNSHNSLYIYTFGEDLLGQLTNIMIPQQGVILDDDFDSFFKSFKYLLALNTSRKDSEGNIVKKSSKDFVRNLTYDYIPLNNGTNGFKDDTTISASNDTILELPCLSSKNSEFIYNDEIEKSAYFAMGQHLAYSFNQLSTGSLIVHANRLFKDDENILFDLLDSNNNHFTLSIVDDKFKVLLGETSFISTSQTSLSETNVWNVITLTWRKNEDNSFNVIVYLNYLKIINTTLSPTETFTTFTVNVGRNSDASDKYGKCFNGLLEMLVFSSTYLSGSVAEIVSTINQQNRISHEYDSLNLLKKTKVVDKNSEILSNSYEYKTLSTDSETNLTRISTLVDKETINDDVYVYDYDVRGNVTSIKKNNSTLHTYTYDKLGRLSASDNEKYNYDGNGNITSVTNLTGTTLHTYTYDTTYSDLLVSFDNQTITYDSGNTYNPVSIGSYQTLTYQCRRLATFRDTNKEFNNFYYYNDLGSRIKKVKYNNSGTLLDTIKYYYDENDKLIYQKSDSISLEFLYDDLNQLYGFIYNNNRYYYVKDCLNTILGIIDSSGSIIVKYNYDAWGNILSINDTSGITLGNINPFRYKCYYYDEDILMYYCKARYYVPSWRRWLTPDSPKYLDGNDTNNLNLFVYCCNNSVMYYDPKGNSIISNISVFNCLYSMSNVCVQKEEELGGLPNEHTLIVNGLTINIKLKQNYLTNISIEKSYKIYDHAKMKEILETIMNSTYVKMAMASGYQFRDIDSYIVEWKAHNMASKYAWFVAIYANSSTESIKDRANSVDLNYNWEEDEWYDFYYPLANLHDFEKIITPKPILLPFKML